MHRTVVTLVAAGLCALLAACEPTPPPTTPTAVPPTARPTEAPRPTSAPPVTDEPAPTPRPAALRIWAAAREPQEAGLRRVLEEAAAAAQIEVSVTTRSPDALYADLAADLLAGEPAPDLVWASQEELALFQRDGLLLPAEDGVSTADLLPATVIGAESGGQRWGTPVAASGALLLLYNKKLTGDAPATTDELIVRSRALSGGEQAGLVAGWAEPRWFVALLAGYGGALIDADGAPTLDTPETLAALNLLKELRVAGPESPSTYADNARLFRRGDAAYALDGDWALDSYRQYTDTLELGVAAMPVVPATGRAAAPPLNGVYLMYTRDLAGARLDQARALATALLQPAAQARIAQELGLLPALRSALADPAIQQQPALAAAAAHAEEALGLPADKELRCAWDALAIWLPSVLLDEQPPDQAAARMQQDAETCASEAGSH